MDQMIFTLIDPGYPWQGWLIILIPVFLFLLGLSIFDRHEEAGGALMGVGFLLTLFFGLFYGFGIGPDFYDAQVNELQADGIESLGFESVNMADDDEFTASLDGEYFRGKLVEIEPGTWQILELVER